jgi:oxalate decarboxylase/phosphoglucose isomerase-like protein (cupin superfamily)
MKGWTALSALGLVVCLSGNAFAQDPVKVDPKHYALVLENPSVRVLKISYPVGDKSTLHQHPDSIVIALAPAKTRFATPDGKSQDVDLASESATYTPAGTHTPTNIGTAPVDALLVEFKAAAPGSATLPASRPNMTSKVLAEGPRATAYRMTADPTFKEPAGTKHDYDQVVIALGDAQMSLAVDGQPAKSSWKRGDTQFIGRGVAHQSANTSGKPVDFVIVAIK